ncbi:MAG TPA: 23S rRNA (uracil(1939)-C(5))-methyltransferase RlmD [Chitinophagales bacterium]|nr:23S rRNA (uracil(1939)-C(5))-methyltransferase RlmD [Chitinophagales bacterium]
MQHKETILTQLPVTAYANEGKTIGHYEGKVVFVKGAVPGEMVNVRVTKNKKDWMEAEVVELLQPSADRQQPFCMHYGKCGGCQWQHMAYEAQLRYKELSVIDTLERIGKVNIHKKEPIVGGPDRYYRNKLEFTFSNREWLTAGEFFGEQAPIPQPALGFHLPGAFDRVFDVKTCFLQDELSNRIRLAVKKFTIENSYDYFHLRNQTGLLRNLMIRIAATGEVMVLVVFAREEEHKRLDLLNFLQLSFPEITSLQYVINQKKNDTIYDLEVVTFAGADAIYECIDDLRFRISAKSFFQTNTRQAAKLYECVRDFAALKGDELVYDLYTGTGSIALYLARSCKKVVGIEQVDQAIEDAKVNAAINRISNISFYVSDIAKILDHQFHAENGTPQVVITDPPRAGMQEAVVKELLNMAPGKIIYVSCNVATQARDLQLLNDTYAVSRIRPFDLFPQTKHVENVAELIMR